MRSYEGLWGVMRGIRVGHINTLLDMKQGGLNEWGLSKFLWLVLAYTTEFLYWYCISIFHDTSSTLPCTKAALQMQSHSKPPAPRTVGEHPVVQWVQWFKPSFKSFSALDFCNAKRSFRILSSRLAKVFRWSITASPLGLRRPCKLSQHERHICP